MFKFQKLMAKRRLGGVEARRRPGHAPFLRDGANEPHVPHIEGKAGTVFGEFTLRIRGVTIPGWHCAHISDSEWGIGKNFQADPLIMIPNVVALGGNVFSLELSPRRLPHARVGPTCAKRETNMALHWLLEAPRSRLGSSPWPRWRNPAS